MKRLTGKIGPVPAVLALLCFSGPVMAGSQVPFQGTFTGFARPVPSQDGCEVTVPLSGAGQATHLGQFTWTSTQMVTDFCALFPDFNAHEDAIAMTAANGDQLFGTGVGTGVLADFADPSKVRVVGDLTITITGGTGRFVNSTGTIRESLVSRVYERTFLPDGSPVDPVTVSLDGSLSSVGADKR